MRTATMSVWERQARVGFARYAQRSTANGTMQTKHGESNLGVKEQVVNPMEANCCVRDN